MTSSMALAPSSPLRNRWLQLILGIVAMIMIANLQYGWTLFVNPIKDRFAWSTAAIQVSFTTFVVIETWLVPGEGYIIDRFGPRRITMIAGVLVGVSWVKLRMAPCPPGFIHRGAIARNVRQGEMTKTPLFYSMYLAMLCVAIGGVMATAQLAPIARDYIVDEVPVTLLLFTLPALQWALVFDRILNGLARPAFGWLSDKIGRENTMFIAFGGQALIILLFIKVAAIPMLFVIISALVFFTYGEIFSLFPSLSADTYGRKFATTNYGLLYTAKGTAALLVPFANILKDATGSWVPIFPTAA